MLDQITGDALLDMYGDDEGPPVPSGEAPRTESAPATGDRLADDERMPLQLSPDEMEGAGGAVPISPEELKRLIDSGAKLKITQAAGEDVEGIGLFITDLLGKLPSEQIDELRNIVGDPESGARRAPPPAAGRAAATARSSRTTSGTTTSTTTAAAGAGSTS